MKRLDRQNEAAEAWSRYDVICCISSSGRLSIGAGWGFLSESNGMRVFWRSVESKLVLEVAYSDSESKVEVRELVEAKLRDRRKIFRFAILKYLSRKQILRVKVF